jgi:hypothetical protein
LRSTKGKARRVSTQEAALLRLKEKALKGDARSLETLLRYAQIFNTNGPNDILEGEDLSASDREILEAYAASVRLRVLNVEERRCDLASSKGTDADE